MIDADNMAGTTRALRDTLTFPLGFARSTEPHHVWQRRTAAFVAEAIGTTDLAVPEVRILSEMLRGKGTAQRLAMDLPLGEQAEAFLLLPDGPGPFPGILLMHDHGAEFAIGKEKVIAPWDDPAAADRHAAWAARLYGGRALGDALLGRGYAVLCMDALGWGSRRGNGYEAQQALAANLMQVGTSLAAVVARDDVRSARFLLAHPLVDPARIAAVGFSFGGFRAWQVAALCPEIRAVVAANWMGRLAGLMVPGNNLLRGQSAFYMLHPALAGRLDFPDFAGLIAPRPALFQAGRQDPHFPSPALESAFTDLAAIWAAAGAAAALVTQSWEASHTFGLPQQEAAFAFLDRLVGQILPSG